MTAAGPCSTVPPAGAWNSGTCEIENGTAPEQTIGETPCARLRATANSPQAVEQRPKHQPAGRSRERGRRRGNTRLLRRARAGAFQGS
jgi:hypothetical protein